MSEYTRRGERKIRPRRPITLSPRNSGGLMSCVRRDRSWGTGGLVSCIDIDYGPPIFSEVDEEFLKYIKERMEKIEKEKSLESFGYFWETVEQS